MNDELISGVNMGSGKKEKKTKDIEDQITSNKDEVSDILKKFSNNAYESLIKIVNDPNNKGSKLQPELFWASDKANELDFIGYFKDISENRYKSIFEIAKNSPGVLKFTGRSFDMKEPGKKHERRFFLHSLYNKEHNIYKLCLLKMRDSNTEIFNVLLSTLNMVKHKDPETGEHLKRLSNISVFLAKKLRGKKGFDIIDDFFIYCIEKLAPIHDIGKIIIPDDILSKNGKLNNEEREIIETHSMAGYKVINELRDDSYGMKYPIEMGANIARYHHEKYDGSGYPDGLSGSKIPVSARIVAISDVFDALLSERPYKKPFSKEKTYKIIKEGRGTHFDPEICDIFIENFDEILEIRNRKYEEDL